MTTITEIDLFETAMQTKLDFQIQQRLGLSIEQIAQFCQKWHITELSLFGSVLGNQFHTDSDIDILIRFAPNTRQGLLSLAKIKHDLEANTGRAVDIALKESVENSENWIRRNEILNTAQVIYGQR
jgi:predicted nucleotidyltransferase